MLIVNHGIVSPTLDVNPTLFVIPCNFLGVYRFIVLQLLSLTKCCFIQISIIHDNIPSQVADKRRNYFGQWMNSSIIHDSICKFIYKRCHPKSYYSEIKYDMTLEIILVYLMRM